MSTLAAIASSGTRTFAKTFLMAVLAHKVPIIVDAFGRVTLINAGIIQPV